MPDDFFKGSETQVRRAFGIDGGGAKDFETRRKIFTIANRPERVQMLQSYDYSVEEAVQRRDLRTIAKLKRERNDLEHRHLVLLRFGK
jgi:hypothetical protein